MSHIRVLLAAVLAASALAVLGGSAQASVPSANTKFCTAAANIGQSTSSTKDLAQLKSAATGFKRAAKQAPPKVKAAMLKIAKLLGGISGSSPSDLAKAYTSRDFVQNYSKSVGVYIKYYVANCGH